jgi:chromosome segregation ATPase
VTNVSTFNELSMLDQLNSKLADPFDTLAFEEQLDSLKQQVVLLELREADLSQKNCELAEENEQQA